MVTAVGVRSAQHLSLMGDFLPHMLLAFHFALHVLYKQRA